MSLLHLLSDISKEEHTSTGFAHHSKPCNCPDTDLSRAGIPDCRCIEGPVKVSALLQVRWKRVILDEGHYAGASSLTNTMKFLTSDLSAESRWIVTGTPTANLLGLNLGNHNKIDQEDFHMNVDEPEDEARLDTAEIGSHGRWNSSDLDDVRRLRIMMAKFLDFRTLQSDDVVKKQLRDPLFHKEGPLPGAISVLSQIMQATMIRHRYVHHTRT